LKHCFPNPLPCKTHKVSVFGNTDPIERVEIQAVFSKLVRVIGWRALQDHNVGGRAGFRRELSTKVFLNGSCHAP
jgi:hypothetical protein